MQAGVLPSLLVLQLLRSPSPHRSQASSQWLPKGARAILLGAMLCAFLHPAHRSAAICIHRSALTAVKHLPELQQLIVTLMVACMQTKQSISRREAGTVSCHRPVAPQGSRLLCIVFILLHFIFYFQVQST